jgi:hypothetical protein
VIALMPTSFDAPLQRAPERQNAVAGVRCFAIATLAGGAIALMATIALLFQTYYESVLRAS